MKVKRARVENSAKPKPDNPHRNKKAFLLPHERHMTLEQRRVIKELQQLAGNRKTILVHHHHSVEEYAAALLRARGVVNDAAKVLGVPPDRVRRAMRDNPNVLKARDEGRKCLLDSAENCLKEHIDAGGRTGLDASKFALTQLGREDGYTKSDGPGEGGITNVFVALFGLAPEQLRAVAQGDVSALPAECVVDAEIVEDSPAKEED